VYYVMDYAADGYDSLILSATNSPTAQGKIGQPWGRDACLSDMGLKLAFPAGA
jgi:hypothetical protein